MSVWTHVAAIVRVDAWDAYSREDFEEVIGKECRWEDDEVVWKDYRQHPDKYLPCGSEGSLKMNVWTNPNESHLAKHVVTIFGDLRDYEDGAGIIEWFKEKVDPFIIRQAVITVETYPEMWTWTYEEDDLLDDEEDDE